MKKIVLYIAFLTITTTANSQNHGELENNFNINQISNLSGGSLRGIDKVWCLNDGSILIANNTPISNSFNNNPVKKVSKLTPTGNLDLTFNFSIPNTPQLNDLAEQSDGKFILVGAVSGTAAYIKRFNVNGTADSSFNVGIGFNSTIYKVNVQTDGKILVAGLFTTFQGVPVNKMVRLNSDGSKDSTFNCAVVSTTALKYFEVQADGKIVIAKLNGVERLNTDGSIDITFNSGALSATFAHIQPDSKIVVVSSSSIMRLNADGTLDLTFNQVTNLSSIVKSFIQSDGKILVVSSDINSVVFSYRYNSDGTVDNSYTPIEQGTDFFMQSDDKVLICGLFWKYDNTLANSITRINSFGLVDATFAQSIGFDYGVFKIKLQPDHKILVGGSFYTYNNFNRNRLIRLNEDGTVDNLFNIGSGFNDNVTAIDIQTDGKIIIGGSFTTYNGIATNHLVRLNNDGSLDSSFQFVLHSNSYINCIAVQSNGKILVASNTCTSRLNSNGSTDTTFSQIYGATKVIKIQNDGKIVIGFGENNFYYNVGINYYGAIKRYNINGTVDNFFYSSSFDSFSNVEDIAIQNDGKILVAGTFDTYDFNPKKGLIRLNTDGLEDVTFNFGTGLTGNTTFAIMCNPTGEIIVNCAYSSATGLKTLMSLNPDGTINTGFNSGKAFNNTFYSGACIEAQYDGKILIGGNFTNYNDYVASGLVRLLGGGYYNLSGQNKLDTTNNGCDPADIQFPNLKFNFNDGSSSYDFFSNTSGNYSFLLNAGNYTITPIVPNTNFSVSPSSISANFPSQYSSLVQNFCLTSTSNSFEDLEVKIIPLLGAIPGFDASYKIIYKNKGIHTVSGNVIFNFNDDVLDLINSTPTFTSQSTNSLNWNFTNLLPQEQRFIIVKLNLNSPTENPSLNIGDVLHYSASITNFPTEISPNDNLFELNQTVFNSYDPNDKTCLEGATVGIEKIGDYVHYLIRFENNGTANAQFIKVIDIIDTSKFDIATLEPVNSSHSMLTKISESNKVEFFFDNINLPFDNANNDGYLMYKIKLKSNLVLGDTFSNKANIYFDFNFPIITNTATSTITALNSQKFEHLNSVSIYPNPANNTLYIKKNADYPITSINIYNMLGQNVNFSMKNELLLDVSNLKAGNYILKLETEAGTITNKFIKL